MDFECEEWTQFRSAASLARHAGVLDHEILPLVAKELVDNALDEVGDCAYGLLEADSFYVENDGEGFKGSDSDIALIFSINRPLQTNKFLRAPSRGRLGNGLRVVAGAVLSLGGTVIVRTAGRSLRLTPEDNGSTAVTPLGPWSQKTTRIEVMFPCLFPPDLFQWADRAYALRGGTAPLRRSSLLWYDSDGFYEVLQAAKGSIVRHLIEQFEGCTGQNAVTLAPPLAKRLATSLTRHEAETLLKKARVGRAPITIERLGRVGKEAFDTCLQYVSADGVFDIQPKKGAIAGTIPFFLELWMTPRPESGPKPRWLVHVNRSPVVGEIWCDVLRNEIAVWGCGLTFTYPVDAVQYDFWLNIQTPYLPLSSNSKAPDLRALNDTVRTAVQSAVRKMQPRHPVQKARPTTTKDFIIDKLPGAIAAMRGKNNYRYSLRQLFYAIRPEYLKNFNGKELNYNNYCQVVSAYEMELGRDLEGIYRDNRGTLYHPHTRESIPLGTLAVENYQRPEWTFNKILYCEKEGFFPLLIDTKWPEQNDCAILTSKGFASKAARDVLDLMGKTDEPLTFFCIHDADGSGTQIYEALQDGTRARPGRDVTIENLGLEPEEARAMNLEVEQFDRGKKRIPVAAYLSAEDTEWLQTNRVELNAMATPDFLSWLDRKLLAHHNGKVIPPMAILDRRLRKTMRDTLEEKIRIKLLETAGFADQVSDAIQSIEPEVIRLQHALPDRIDARLQETPVEHWVQPVDRVAEQLAHDFFSRTSDPSSAP